MSTKYGKTSGILCLIILAIGLNACGGNSGGPSAFDGEYGGTWNVRINLSLDECLIVEPGVLGFVDRQIIDQEGISITIESSTSFGTPYTGTVREDQSFAANDTVSGDLFGDGIPCTASQELSYSPTDSDSASVIFRRTIDCADGYACESRGLGEATRQ